jgi:hypothetical protein
MEAVAIVSIITSFGVLLTVFSKTIKKSTCCSCLNCETRTPPPSVQYIPPHPTPQPSPQPTPQVVRNNILREVEV